MQSRTDHIRLVPPRKAGTSQTVDKKQPKIHHRVVSPQFRAIIAEECRQHGSVATAKAWNITVSAALECRLEALDKVLTQHSALLARLEKRAA